MTQDQTPPRQVGFRLFWLSFAALFLELMVIRWVPSEVRLVAYYANLMLVSSFLGLGVGAMVASRGWNLFRFFAPVLAVYILFLLLPGILQAVNMLDAALSFLPGAAGEWRFQNMPNREYSFHLLTLIFILNAIAFIPLGDEVGRQFHRLPALEAYSWDLGGALAGTVCFGAFSLLHFSPIGGMALVMLVTLLLSRWKERFWGFPCYGISIGAMVLAAGLQSDGSWSWGQPKFWSPYYFISITERKVQLITDLQGQFVDAKVSDDVASVPPKNLRTMQDPPIYTVQVNQDFYQLHGTLDPDRYTVNNGIWYMVEGLRDQYRIPYEVTRSRDRVLVLGAGGGMDVQTAILSGARRVDAVEIDPLIASISSQYSADAPYDNPIYEGRVVLHIDDARSFLQNTTDMFDVVVFGFLDSQALFSYGASLRLDGYTYTIESFRKAYERVKDGGVLSISFVAGKPWMLKKLAHMIEQATGTAPHVYFDRWRAVMVVTKGPAADLPASVGIWKRLGSDWESLRDFSKGPVIDLDLASDDWPYLYLEKKSIPRDYLIVINILLYVSILSLAVLRGTAFGTTDAHFLFLGWGFLLLQTKSIGDCSLYFGTTWFVTTLVIAGVLLMVLVANWVAIKCVAKFSPWLYAPLLGTLAILLFVPREVILGQTYGVRLAWTLFIVPVPIFFAGLIFSTTFREASNPSALFGSNLMGATIGGFCEYLGMWIGTSALSYIIIAVYLASFISLRLRARSGGLKPLGASV